MYYCFSDITNMANLLTFVCLSWLFTDSTDSTYISDELILMQYSQYRSVTVIIMCTDMLKKEKLNWFNS